MNNVTSMNFDHQKVLRTVKTAKMATIVMCLSALFGCASITHMTAGPVERQSLLTERTEKFHRELSFGNPVAASEFVNPEKRIEFLTRYKGAIKGQTVVSVDVQDVEFGEEAKDATVVASVRYFQNPSYHVQTREDKEIWIFSRSEGWLFDGIVGSEEKGRTALDSHLGR